VHDTVDVNVLQPTYLQQYRLSVDAISSYIPRGRSSDASQTR
jgi:hypothetical protein